MVALLLAAVSIMLSQRVLERPAEPVVGQVLEVDLYAPRGFIYRDWIAADEAVRAEFSRLPQPYSYDATGFEEGVRRLRAYFEADGEDSRNPELVIAQPARRQKAWRQIEGLIARARGEGLLDKSFARDETLSLLDKEGRQRTVRSQALLQPGAWERHLEGLSEDEAARVAGLLDRHFIPTIRFDEVRAQRLYAEIARRIPPADVAFPSERPIIAAGQELNERHVDIIRQLNLFLARRNTLTTAALVLFLVLVLVLGFLFLKYQLPGIYDRLRDVAAISFAFGSVLLVCLISELIIARLSIGTMTLSYAALPVATCAVLLALIYDARVALIFPVLLCVVVSVAIAPRSGLLVVHLFGSLAALLSAPASRRRSDLLRTGLIISVTQAVTVVLLGVLSGEPFPALQSDLLSAVISGIFAAIVAQVLLLPLEAISHRVSAFTLLELADLNQPLLAALLRQAPGTFQHSQHVALLVQSAAEAVHANSLLARVGAYYHDIGKMEKPEYFTENQGMGATAGRNPHDTLSPSLSASVIRAHVSDGIRLAEKERLPEPVIDFISQHHGTAVMGVFYHRALERAGEDDEINRADFAYPGPRPQTIETGILMLADAAEAATRSLAQPTAARIERTVQRVIADIFESGELDECELTLKDLNTIAGQFTRVLCGIYHSRRVEYPDASDIAEAQRRR